MRVRLSALIGLGLGLCRDEERPPFVADGSLQLAIRTVPGLTTPSREADPCVALASISPVLRDEIGAAARETLARLHLRAHPLGVDLDDTPVGASLALVAPRVFSMMADAALAIDGAALDEVSQREVALSDRCVSSDDTLCLPLTPGSGAGLEFSLWPATRSLHLRFDGREARVNAETALAGLASSAQGLVSVVIPARVDRARCRELLAWAHSTFGELGEAVPGLGALVAARDGDAMDGERAIHPAWTRIEAHDLLVVPRASALPRIDEFIRSTLAAVRSRVGETRVHVIRLPLR